MGGWLCPVCGCQERPAVCSSCINTTLENRQRELEALKQRRRVLRERLDAKLELRRELERQQAWRRDQDGRCEQLRRAFRVAEGSCQKERTNLQGQQDLVKRLSTQLENAQQQLEGKRKELGSHTLILRAHLLSLNMVQHELVQKRHNALRQLCSIFPLRVAVVDVPETWDGAQKLSQVVRICGVRLMEGDSALGMPASELAAALGYMLQFLQLVAKYLSAPLLHNAGFAVSSSKVWQRASYWNPRPQSASHQYPLYLPRPGAASSTTEGEASPSEPVNGAPPLSPPSLPHPLLPSQKQPSGGSGSANSGASVGKAEAKDYRPLRKGIFMLKRSIMCLCSHQESLMGVKLPRYFSPFASLAKLMEWITRDPRSSGLSSRSRHLELNASSGYGYGSIQAGKSSLAGQGTLFAGPPDGFPSTQFQSFAQSVNLALESVTAFEEEPYSRSVCETLTSSADQGLEEWDLVERLPLPPPPSRAEDVEHWTRAMFIDATR